VLKTSLFSKNFIFGKTKAIYLVNKVTGKIYSDTPVSIPQTTLNTTANKYPLDKSAQYTQDPSLNQWLLSLKDALILKDPIKIRDFFGGSLLTIYDVFTNNPNYSVDNRTEYYAKELHNKNSTAWGEVLNAIEAGGAKENSDRDFYIFPWYEEGLDKYLGTWDDSKDLYNNALVDIFDACAVLGDNVALRSAPNTTSSTMAKLSWQVVKIVEQDNKAEWLKISSLDNTIEGYISSDSLFTPWTTRVIIRKIDNSWKIIAFRTAD